MRQVNYTRISLLSKRLKVIAKTKKDLTRQLEELEVESIAKRNELNSLRNEDAPISSLPNEVLSLIFDIGHQIPRGYTIKGARSLEISVSHVTTHWRYVALGMPSLWTKIIRAQYQQNFDSLSAYLRRSDPLPFDLSVSIGSSEVESEEDYSTDEEFNEVDDVRSEEMEDIGPFFELIKPHLERCRKLLITSQEHAEGIRLLRLLSPISTSSLNSIRVHFYEVFRGETVKIFQGGAPALAQLELEGVPFDSCRPPTSNLTALLLGSFTSPRKPHEFRNIGTSLSAMHVLSHLELEAPPSPLLWPSDVSITLRALRSVVITSMESRSLSALLLALDAPLLADVSFAEGISDDGELDDALTVHCPSHLPSVRRLCLMGGFTQLSARNLRTLSLAFPLVTNLSHSPTALYKRAKWSYGSIELLQEGGVWPNIRSLQIPLSKDSFLPIKDLKQVLVYRANAGYPIRTISFPESHIEKGLTLASCTQPPVQVIQYADDAQCPFPEWSFGGGFS